MNTADKKSLIVLRDKQHMNRYLDEIARNDLTARVVIDGTISLNDCKLVSTGKKSNIVLETNLMSGEYPETGVCASGLENHYVSFYPEGRMDLYAALVRGAVPVTEQCVAIAEGCDLCGRCDYQCAFVTGMRPTRVMAALKAFVADHLAAGKKVLRPVDDPLLNEIRDIVGERWATNDRAIAAAYAYDPSPLAETILPRLVVMPGSTSEVSAIVRVFSRWGVPFAARGAGTNLLGYTLTEGAVIDLGRMTTMDFDEPSWSVKVGPRVYPHSNCKGKPWRKNTG